MTKSIPMRPHLLLLCGLFAWCATPASQAGGVYRWVDDQGRIHYSDQIPPQEINKPYSVINDHGITVRNVEATRTPEQRAEDERQARLKEDDQRRVQERRTYDRLLLDTYTSETNINETRDRHVATLEGLIEVAQHKVENIKTKLDELTRHAANLERGGKPIRDELKADIESLQRQITEQEHYIAAQRQAQDATRGKYAADLQRFKELKALEAEAKP